MNFGTFFRFLFFVFAALFVSSCKDASPELQALQNLRNNNSVLAPHAVTISQSPTQIDPTANNSVSFAVTFGSDVNTTTFLPGSINTSGSTAAVSSWTITQVATGNYKNFIITAILSPGIYGTVIPKILANTVAATDGNFFQASTSGDNQVTYGAPAVLTLSSSYNFGNVLLGSNAEATLTVTHASGAVAATSLGSTLTGDFHFKGGGYPGNGGDCGANLQPGSSCHVVVVFSPATKPLQTQTLNINYNDGVTGQSVSTSLSGSGVSPAALTISDINYDFSNVVVGNSSYKVFQISNTGDLDATGLSPQALTSFFNYRGGSYPGSPSGNCGATLTAGTSCFIEIAYAPTASGAHSSAIRINYNDGASSQLLQNSIQGTGLNPANITVNLGNSYDFGDRPNNSVLGQVFVLTNSGGTAASGLNISIPVSDFSIPTSDCGASLAAGLSCNVTVNFSPTALGARTGTLNIGYANGVTSVSSPVSLTGNGVSPATLAIISPAFFPFDYGTKGTGSVTSQSFTLRNTGGYPATSISGGALTAPFAFNSGSFSNSGNCTSTLGAGASCTFSISFSPTTSGLQSNSLNINYIDGVTSQLLSKSIQGTGATPAAISITGSSFPTITAGTNYTQSFTVQNTGELTATSLTGTVSTSPKFAFNTGVYPGSGTGACGATLPGGGASCTVWVTYSPTVANSDTGSINLNFNNGISSASQSLNISGAALSPALLVFEDANPFSFGAKATGTVSTFLLTVKNNGGTAAGSIARSGLSSPFSFGAGGTCTSSLAAGSSCMIEVIYNPTTSGSYSNQIQLSYTTGASTANATIDVQGSAFIPASLSISDASVFDYGTQTQGSVTTHLFRLTNSGGVTATAVGIPNLPSGFDFAGGVFPGGGGNCGLTLAAGTFCDFEVRFVPTAVQTYSGIITVSYNDGVGTSTSVRNVQGTSVARASLSISSPPSYIFATQPFGVSNDVTLTVTNSGGSNATGMGSTSLATPFSFPGGYPGIGGDCTGVLGPGLQCHIVIRYSPIAANTDSGTITIDYFDGAINTSVSRSVQGTAVAPANLVINGGATKNFGSVVNGGTTQASITVSNTGGWPATITGQSSGAPFVFLGGSYPGTSGDCNGTLPAGSNCTIVVSFSPTSLGSLSGSISINYSNGATNTSATLNLQGVGVNPANIVVTGTTDFGKVTPNTSKNTTLTLTNNGGVSATGINLTGLVTPFTLSGGFPGPGGTCTGNLAGGGGNCTVVVTFTPSSATHYSNNLSFNFNNGISNTSTSVTIQGDGYLMPAISGYSTSLQSLSNYVVPNYSLNATSGKVTATVNFNKAVNVVGTPCLEIYFGLTLYCMNYSSGTGGTALTFVKNLDNGIGSYEGIRVATNLNLNGGTISDSGGVNADLTITPTNYTNVFAGSGFVDLTNQSDYVYAFGFASDGKIYAGGEFAKVHAMSANNIASLMPDGNVNTSFNTGTGFGGGLVYALAVASDGSVFAGGTILTYNGVNVPKMIKIQPNGSKDPNFTVSPLGTVNTIAITSDGSVLVGGTFSSFNSQSVNRIAKVNPTTGALDTTFKANTGTAFNSNVNVIKVQSDGKILVGGTFGSFNGSGNSGIARLNADGTRDTGFTGPSGLANIYDIDVDASGSIYAVGNFAFGTSPQYNQLIKLNSNGSVDTNFLPSGGGVAGSGARVNSIVVQNDGKPVFGGYFTDFNGTGVNALIRLNSSNGSLDTTLGFTFNAGAEVSKIVKRSDGKLFIGGNFTWVSYSGQTYSTSSFIRLPP